MHKIYIIVFLGVFLFGCQPKQKEVIRERAIAQVLDDDIMTHMPGTLLVAGDYLVWEDPFARDYFVNVHDASTGKKVGQMGKVGEGPAEFVTGSIQAFCINQHLFASDINGNTVGFLSINNLLAGKEPFIPLSEAEKSNRPQMTELQKDIFVGWTENGDEHYFKANIHGRELFFGNYPVKELREHVGNSYAYDSISGMLACSSFSLPYLSLYERKGDTFVLRWEMEPEKGYEVNDGHLVLDERIGGIFGLSLCKDYIVALHRDWENEPLDKPLLGRDERALPHYVFLHDYDSQLVKVVDLGMPIVRIASDRRSNTLYALGLNPDYVLVKYKL